MGLDIGTLCVRRSIYIEASCQQVWQQFVSLEKLSAWLGMGQTLHIYDARKGGKIDFSVTIDDEERHFGGDILYCEPDNELSFEVQWQAPHGWPVPTYWTIRLSSINDGTHVELFHHGFEGLGDQAADSLQGYEEGWQVRHLAALRQIVLNQSG